MDGHAVAQAGLCAASGPLTKLPQRSLRSGTGAATTVSLALAAAVMLLLLYATTGPSAQGVR